MTPALPIGALAAGALLAAAVHAYVVAASQPDELTEGWADPGLPRGLAWLTGTLTVGLAVALGATLAWATAT